MTLLGPDQVTDTVAMVAQPPSTQEDPGGQGEDFGKSSPVGLLVLLLFFVAVAFLVRSMTKHLKRVPASFDPPSDEPSSDEPSSEEPPSDGPPSAAKESETAPPSNGDQQDSADGGAAAER